MMDDLRPRTRGLSSCPICHYPGRRSFLTWRIRAFRGIGELTMPRLGLVTLIAGRNDVGRPLSYGPVPSFSRLASSLFTLGLFSRVNPGLPQGIRPDSWVHPTMNFVSAFWSRAGLKSGSGT